MGIVNLTDNSFISSSRMAGKAVDEIVSLVASILEDGASYIDVGACSTAPGNEPISAEQEWGRLEKPLDALFSTFPDVEFSIDTFRPQIIEKILKFDRRFIVNDITAGEDDARMLPLVAASGLKYIAMDRTQDPYSFFETFASKAYKSGINDWILDPGFGFGKTVQQNWDVLNSLERLLDFGRPVLVALSRKRMVYIPDGLTPDTCREKSIAAENLAISKGASIVRTHDLRRQ